MKSTRNGKTSNLASRNILKAAVMATPALLLAVPVSTRAADVWWDTNGAAAGSSGGTTAPGTWESANWTTDSTGASATAAWTADNIADFAAGTNATGSYNVTIGAAESISGIKMEEGGTITLTGTGSLTLDGATPTISLNTTTSNTVHAAARNMNVLVPLAGSNGLTIAGGSGTITLAGTNTYTGVTTIGQYNGSGAETGFGLGGDITVVVTNNNALGAGGAGNDVTFLPSPSSTSDNSIESKATLRLGNGVHITNKKITLFGGFARERDGQLTVVSGGSATWSGDISMSHTNPISASTPGSGNVSNVPMVGAPANSTLTLDGAISNDLLPTSWYMFGGYGTTVLNHDNSATFNGGMRLNNGTLVIQADGALGAACNDGDIDGTLVEQQFTRSGFPTNDPRVAFQAPSTSPGGFAYADGDASGTGTYKVITLQANSGSGGFNGSGQAILDNLGGNNTFGGAIRFGFGDGGATAVGVTADSLTLSGRIYASAFGTGVSARTLVKVGTGKLVIAGNNDGTDGATFGFGEGGLWGTVDVRQGTFALASADPTKGTLFPNTTNAGTSWNVLVEPGATFMFDNSLAANSNRMLSTQTFNLVGGDLQMVGNSGTDVTEQVGNITLGASSSITLNANGHHTEIAPASLIRNGQATALIRGLDGVNGVMNTTSSTTLVGAGTTPGAHNLGILPWGFADASATGNGSDLMTISDGTGNAGPIRPLSASEYDNGLTEGDTSLDNIAQSSSQSFSTPSSITQENAMKMTGSGTTIDTQTGFLQLQSGALLSNGTNQVINGRLRFGTYDLIGGSFENPNIQAEGVVYVTTGSDLTINADIRSELGLTKGGNGNLTLTNTNNAYIGTTAIVGGNLIASGDVFGDPSNSIALEGGSLDLTGSFSAPGRAIAINSPISNVIDVSSGNAVTFGGAISGSGALTKNGAGKLQLDTTGSSYTGWTYLNGGIVQVSGAGGLGNAQINLQGGTLHITGSTTMVNPLLCANASAGLVIDSGQTVTWSGFLGGTQQLIIDGGGTFNPTNNNGNSGGHLIKGGSTLLYTVAQGQGGDTTSTSVPYFELDNGTVQTIGQVVNSSGTNGVGSFSSLKTVKLDAGGGTFDVEQGATTSGPYTLTLGGKITGAGDFTKKGAGTTLLLTNSSSNYTGATNVLAGTVQLNASNTTTSAVNVSDGAKYAIGKAGNRLLHTGTLNLNSTGTLDLNDNDLVVDNGDFNTIQGLVFNGYRQGADPSATGIISTTGQTAVGNPILALFNNTLVGTPDYPFGSGQTVSASAVIGKYTYIGDTNWDGQVTPDDYGALDANLGATGIDPGIAWFMGDSNFDGSVTPDDYGALDANLGLGVGNPLSANGLIAANGVAAVPEPGSIALLGAAGVGMLLRRRRTK